MGTFGKKSDAILFFWSIILFSTAISLFNMNSIPYISYFLVFVSILFMFYSILFQPHLRVFKLFSSFILFGFIFTVAQYRLYGFDSYKTLGVIIEMSEEGRPIFDVIGTPLLHNTVLMNDELFSLTLENSMKFTILIYLAGLFLFYFFWIREIASVKVATISTIALLSVPAFTMFHAWVVKETVALTFLFLFLYMLYLDVEGPKLYFTSFALSFATLIVLSHHLTSLLLLMITGSFVVSYLISDLNLETVKMKKPLQSRLLVIVIFSILVVSYWTFVYTDIIYYASPYVGYLLNGLSVQTSELPSTTVAIEFDSYYWLFREYWTSWNILYLGLFILLGVAIRFNLERYLTTNKELIFVIPLSMLVSLFFITLFANPILGTERILNLSYLFSIPLCVKIGIQVRRDDLFTFVMVLFVLVNLAFFPWFSLSPEVESPHPVTDTKGFNHYEYSAVTWSEKYTTAQIGSSKRLTKFFEAYLDNVPRRDPRWVGFIGTEQDEIPAQIRLPQEPVYLYEGPTMQKQVAIRRLGMLRVPDYRNNTQLQMVYSNGGSSTIYRLPVGFPDQKDSDSSHFGPG